MKEFFKWLGVNEKIAKIVVWILIMMVCLIIINVFLESIGAPYYGLTVDNLTKTNENNIFVFISAAIVTLLGFYSIVLLVFDLKHYKQIFKYALLYTILDSFIVGQFDYVVSQIFIVLYILTFCYLYSNKKWEYIFYGIASFVINTIVQYIWYLYKARFLEFSDIGETNRLLVSIDFYIIMFIIILIKELYFKKRRDKNGTTKQLAMATNVQKRGKISKEISKNVNEVKDKS